MRTELAHLFTYNKCVHAVGHNFHMGMHDGRTYIPCRTVPATRNSERELNIYARNEIFGSH